MSKDSKKIGHLISEVRRERGLTQAEFAKKLKTSQSAVNRIENGKQNLSMQMLGRISEVLERQIVEVKSGGTINFKIEGGRELKGDIEVKVSKNATVAIICASLLNKGTTIIERAPRIEEVNRLIEVIQSMGVKVKWHDNGDLELKPPARLKIEEMDEVAAKRTRSVLMFLGPLVHLAKEFTIPYPGGCKLGTRTVRPHLYALEEFGVDIKAHRGRYHITKKLKQPGTVVLYEMGDTVSENALMAAAKTPGKTRLHKMSGNYMVQELCFYLQSLGVKVEGIGNANVTVTGKPNIKKTVRYSPSEDPIEAMMFLSLAATTNSAITIKRAPIEFLELELLKLKKMGFNYKILKRYKAKNGSTELVDIKTLKTDRLYALDDKIHPQPYPGLNIDNLPFFVPIAARAHGRTLIHDWVYENRAIYYTELSKLGADIELADSHRIYINGPTHFKAAELITPPALRPAVIVLIGMLAANGTSVLRNVYSINRGYEDLANRLNSLGAKVEILHD
ncbi:MAG: UDP-N-acetylglucosamine 1-carboxyvinyltransferase [Candidatus Saccharimonadales bacterium]|nr:UDP-N-acetylglucosamine 1-carboxyvinyltransferase [Candidatus Saccharimonadales bacterium]